MSCTSVAEQDNLQSSYVNLSVFGTLQAHLADCEALPQEFEADHETSYAGGDGVPDLTSLGLGDGEGGKADSGSKTELPGGPQSAPGDKGETMTAEQAEALLQVFSNPLYSARQPTRIL